MKPRTCLALAVAGLLLSVSCPAPVAQSAQATKPDVFAFVRALDDAASRQLWPGFNPSTLPIALFDGEHTLLLRHPSPPPEFSPMPGHTGVLIAPGRHPSVVSNSTRDIGDVRTATVIATPAESVESTSLAVMEEVFHVFWLGRHLTGRPNEMARYAYPLDDARNLGRLLAEGEALARALEAPDVRETSRWAATALDIRRERTPALVDYVSAFETSLEMMEGTANYVARKAVGEPVAKTVARLRIARPAQDIRWRFYDTGAALCFLADRLSQGWKERLDREPDLTLAELVGSVLRGGKTEPAAFTESEREALVLKAAASVKELELQQRKVRGELLDRPGARVIVDVAQGVEAFRVQRFDPINLMVLGAGEMAHANFVTLTGPRGTIELANPRFARGTFSGSVAVTVPAGQHPLADGIRQLTIVGIDGTPKVGRDGETIALEAPGVRLTLRGVEAAVDGEAVRITVKKSSSG